MKFLVPLVAFAAVALASPLVSTWTFAEVNEALQDPSTDPTLVPALVEALNVMMEAMYNGETMSPNPTATPAVDVSTWTLSELTEALQDPETNPALIPYLEHALNEYMETMYSGQQVEAVIVVTPVGLVPTEVPVVAQPVVIPEVVSTPEAVAEFTASSPLVQLIININTQQVAQGVAPGPIESINVDPVSVVDVAPEPVSVVEVNPEPVMVVEASPEPVMVVENSPVIVVQPEVVVNPIDVIAVAAAEGPIVTPVVAGAEVDGPLV